MGCTRRTTGPTGTLLSIANCRPNTHTLKVVQLRAIRSIDTIAFDSLLDADLMTPTIAASSKLLLTARLTADHANDGGGHRFSIEPPFATIAK